MTGPRSYPDTTDAAFRWSCSQCNYSVTPNEIFSERKHFDAHALECVRCLYRTETKPTWEEAKAAYCRAPAQGAWMPIESAPKPNVDVMLWYPWASAPCKGAPAGFRYIARWTGTDSGEDCWRDPVDFEPIGDAPTHWQPLPDGPSVPSTTLGGAA